MAFSPSAPTVATRRGKSSLPLSSPHLLPASPPMTPMSPTLMSPPMTAKSFGTFIDSAPSTPAYSPRTGGAGWDGSTLMLLSPASTTPSSPPEPEWEMLAPVKQERPSQDPPPPPRMSVGRAGKYVEWKGSGTALASHPVYRSGQEVPPRREEYWAPSAEEEEEKLDNAGDTGRESSKEEQQGAQSAAAPLERIATRMKSILRRPRGKTVTDNKKSPSSSSSSPLSAWSENKLDKRRRKYQDLDYMEDVHWTEM
ncbi:uncharacterized protein EI97DRAFT_457765 [Westerdykella ornata]|uniref:Uncharacterized protein n=1 Tax=Westerdykella ornata TaxID=318751 RepID=A0A6A6JKM3_WESOR|nr:uncharacterized protein EI97DRAFT_457765 [Westerdykella ornata]KAF2277032.1 hypothetical protein EI97DRAFT_457765 [Westerdykella ornata]